MSLKHAICALTVLFLGGSTVTYRVWAAEPAEVMQTLLEKETAGPVCGPSPMRVEHVCEPGGGFLCVNSPPGGTTADAITISGLIDQQNFPFAGLKVVVQHAQTNQLQEIDTTAAVDAQGHFAFTVALPRYGAYAIIVQALRANGAPAIERVDVSRVVAPNAREASVTMSPDPASTEGVLRASSVMVAVDLLPQCENCDNIGSGTGGVLIRVHNRIVDEAGHTQSIMRQTNIGADGKFQLCLPVADGNNALTISVCNAATGFAPDACPRLSPMIFTALPQALRIIRVTPDTATHPAIAASRAEALPVSFRVEGLPETEKCSESVFLEWNREAPRSICPDATGLYVTQVQPAVGINLGRIRVTTEHEDVTAPFTLGWGKLHSPWANSDLWESDTLTIGVRQEFMAETMRGLMNNLAASDRVEEVVRQLVDQPVAQPASARNAAGESAAEHREGQIARIRREIPHCTVDGGLSGTRIQLVEPPEIGQLDIANITFAEDEMQLKIVVQPRSGESEALVAKLRLFRDENDDGLADGPALPIKIGFRKLVLHPRIRLDRADLPRVLLTAETTSCDYQSQRHCSQRPAVLLPRLLVGSATPTGGFVVCDHEDQVVPETINEGCADINRLNAQTGLLSSKVLDAVNEMLYCQGSSLLTYFLREGAQKIWLQLGCGHESHADEEAFGLPVQFGACDAESGLFAGRSYDLPVGFDLVRSIMRLNTRGMNAQIATRVGHPKLFGRLPPVVQSPSVGYFTELRPPRLPIDQGLRGVRDVSFGLSATWLNQLFFLMGVQGDPVAGTGPLDWNLHEAFFAEIGFDFTAECDEFDPRTSSRETPPALCQLRPRVKDLLGSALTTAEYFPPNQPLMMQLRGSRALMPHVRFYAGQVAEGAEEDGQPTTYRPAQFIDVQIPDLSLAFYALKTDPSGPVDAYGNPTVLRGADGKPVIHSMRPDVPDPRDGPIIAAQATLLLALEIGAVEPDPEDPSQVELLLRPDPNQTRFYFTIPPGANSTIIPDQSLLSNFREKLLTGITLFSTTRNAVRIKMKKRVVFSHADGSMLSEVLRAIGLHEVRLAKDGLEIGVDPGQGYLTLNSTVNFTQRLVVGGELITWSIPE